MTRSNYLFATLMMALIAMAICLGPALAQERFTIRDTEQERFLGAGAGSTQNQGQELRPTTVIPSQMNLPSFPKMMFGQNNKYFNDVVTIQYQISLLKVLVERQSQNLSIAESLRGIGLEFNEPPPARSVCEELPKNLLCVRFYPSIYGMDDISPVQTSREQISLQDMIKDRPKPPVLDGEREEAIVDLEALEEDKGPEKAAPKKFAPPYQWTEISCVAGQCKAALLNQRTGQVISVSQGDFLDLKQEILVSEIAFNSVVLSNEKGEMKKLKPAPSPESGGPASTLLNMRADQRRPSVAMSEPIPEDQPFEGPSRDSLIGEDEDIDVDQLIEDLGDEADDEIVIVDE